MDEVLFIAHRIPFPPDRGDKIRSHHVLKAIAALAPVHVATFADDDADLAAEPDLAALASSYKLVRRAKPLPIAGLEALARSKPVSLTAFHDRALADYIDQVLATRPIAAIYVFSGQMGQYVPASFKGRVIADFVDVDSAKFDAYAAGGKLPMRWVHAREARQLRSVEAQLAARADTALLISAEEAALFRSRLTPAELAKSDIRVLGNGINSTAFDPDAVAAEPALLAFPAPRLIFTGQMDYAPNIAAARRVIERILPLIRRILPEASFHIVGRNPAPELMAHDGQSGVHIHGRVPDMRTWLKAADLALVPLDIARGVQNKVLEAMAMGLPVVLTSGAATGIPAINGNQLRIADSDDELAAAVIATLADPAAAQAMGTAARRQVIETASWPAALAALPEMLGLAPQPARDAA